MKKVFFILISLFFLNTLEARGLNFKQVLTLKTVKNVALQYPNKRGETLEHTAMAICMTETSGGKVTFGDKQLLKKSIKRGSYGVMQVQLPTAKFVAKQYKLYEVLEMSDVELITTLMKDRLFGIKIAVLYVVWLSNHSKSKFEAISRYNGGKVNHPYYNRVMKNMKIIKKYNL
jgi:hypothetical protein